MLEISSLLTNAIRKISCVYYKAKDWLILKLILDVCR